MVLDKKDYTKKVDNLLRKQQTYKIMPTDPTTKQKNR